MKDRTHTDTRNQGRSRSWRDAIIGAALCLVLASTTMAPLARAAEIRTAGSELVFTFTQMNVPVRAAFRKFGGNIEFPGGAAPASAKVNIAADSVDLGEPDYNAEVLKKEWLNAAQFPQASFTSTAVRAVDPEGRKLEIAGNLSIKGKTMPVRFPVTVTSTGNGRMVEGMLPISRLAFNLGEGDWRDTSIVADRVTIHFRLLTQP